jgi:hypothetical protein
VPKHTAEAKGKAVEESDREETAGPPKILSPPLEPELPKVSKDPAITPKRRRMASVFTTGNWLKNVGEKPSNLM